MPWPEFLGDVIGLIVSPGYGRVRVSMQTQRPLSIMRNGGRGAWIVLRACNFDGGANKHFVRSMISTARRRGWVHSHLGTVGDGAIVARGSHDERGRPAGCPGGCCQSAPCRGGSRCGGSKLGSEVAGLTNGTGGPHRREYVHHSSFRRGGGRSAVRSRGRGRSFSPAEGTLRRQAMDCPRSAARSERDGRIRCAGLHRIVEVGHTAVELPATKYQQPATVGFVFPRRVSRRWASDAASSTQLR